MDKFLLAMVIGIWATVLTVMLGGVVIFFMLAVTYLGWWVLILPVGVVMALIAIVLWLWKGDNLL